MFRVVRRSLVPTLACVTVLGLAVSTAHAQRPAFSTLPLYSSGVHPNMPYYNPATSLYRFGPGATQQQIMLPYYMNQAATATLPPWLYGYTPPGTPTPQYAGAAPLYNPLSPYGGGAGFGGYAPNPYGGGGYGNPYVNLPGAGLSVPLDPGNPYLGAGLGANPYTAGVGNMYSAATYGSGYGAGYPGGDLRQQGTLMLNQEMARLMREQVKAAQMKNQLDKITLEKAQRESVQTFTDQQRKVADDTLKRIQTQATPAEINSGRAQNVLLDDLRQHRAKRLGIASPQLDETVLKDLNVTGQGGGNLGLLVRNQGQITLPAAFQQLIPADEQKDLATQAQAAWQQATSGQVNPNILKDLSASVDKLSAKLQQNTNEIKTEHNLEARRFLNDFRDAITGLKNNLAPAALDYQRFVKGGKTVQDLTDYMADRGLNFAPAVAGTEPAYQALHTGLANYDVAVNAQLAAGPRQ